MIKLHISSNDLIQIEEIIIFLLKEKLVLDVNLEKEIARVIVNSDKINYTKQYLVTAKTKSTLFNDIEIFLQEIYGDNMPELYSLPIVNMKWSQKQILVDSLK